MNLRGTSNPKFNTTFIKKSDLLPEHYTAVNEPVYQGKGNHSVSQLEAICEQFKEFVHQQRIREQTICQRGDIEIVNEIPDCESVGRLHMQKNQDKNCAFCGADLGKAAAKFRNRDEK